MKKVPLVFDPNRHSVGIIFRVFAQKESQLPERLLMSQNAIEKALQMTPEFLFTFKKITVLVPVDERYPSHDFGGTAAALKKLYGKEKRVEILEVMGDIFCAALNVGIASQSAQKIHYSLVVSPDAHEYLTPENVRAVLNKAKTGARVVGLAINELKESIQTGCIANTFALWHNESLQSVGMFNIPLSGEPRSDKDAVFLTGYDENKTQQFYKINGVEEIIPCLLMGSLFGSCIGVVDEEMFTHHYKVVHDKELQQRHRAKMATKLVRQRHQAFAIGYDLSCLKNYLV